MIEEIEALKRKNPNKEIFIKVYVHPISNYVMSCLKTPNTFLLDVERNIMNVLVGSVYLKLGYFVEVLLSFAQTKHDG